MARIRLDKYLADAGQGTRSGVKQLLRQGRVTVNGVAVKGPDIKVDSDTDCIAVDGRQMCYAEYEYYMLNKPAGFVSATSDNKERTVIELISCDRRRDLFPVGRLDKDTEGLLLITNDGALANNLLAPGKHVPKTYYARVDGAVTDEIVKKFADGLDIGDEKPTAPAGLVVVHRGERHAKGDWMVNEPIKEDVPEEGVSEVEITITEGRYHQIKRMFQAVGMKVLSLKRLGMGPLTLDRTLACGDYRRLTEEELKSLKEVHGNE